MPQGEAPRQYPTKTNGVRMVHARLANSGRERSQAEVSWELEDRLRHHATLYSVMTRASFHLGASALIPTNWMRLDALFSLLHLLVGLASCELTQSAKPLEATAVRRHWARDRSWNGSAVSCILARAPETLVTVHREDMASRRQDCVHLLLSV